MGKMVSKPQAVKARLEQAMRDLDTIEARIGWFGSSKYPDGTPVAYVASIQEHGAASQGIPPRPFFAPTVAERTPQWKQLMAQGVKAIGAGNQTAETVMDAMGLQAAGDVRVTISQIQSPPLAAATLAARKRAGNGSRKPLVDTRYMIATLTSTVSKK